MSKFLGLAQPTLVDGGALGEGAWEPLATVAERLGLAPEEAASAIEVARGRWLRTPALTTVRGDIESSPHSS